MMNTVFIRLESATNAIKFSNVDTYEKGSFYCVRLEDETIYRYPIRRIFDVREIIEGPSGTVEDKTGKNYD